MATNPMRLSADDVLEIPVPDHLRGYELVDGELVEVSLVGIAHACIAADLAGRMTHHARERGIDGYVCVDAGYVLRLPRDPERLRGPDVSFVTGANLRAHGGAPRRGYLRIVPELVIEIDSPGRRPRIEHERIKNYLDAGVALIWVIHTRTRSATVYRGDGSARIVREEDALDAAVVLPELRVPLADLFDRVPPGALDQ